MFNKVVHFLEGAAVAPLGLLIGNVITGAGAQISTITHPVWSMAASGALLVLSKVIKDWARSKNILVQ